MKKKPHLRNNVPSTWLLGCLMAVVAFVGWYSGWFAGCSRASISASVVPLLFGLLTAFLFIEINWTRVIATPLFILCFMIGYDFGENVDEPLTVDQVLELRKIDISDAIYDELTLLDATMRNQEIDTRRHNAILVSIGARIAEDPSLALDQQLESLKSFRMEVQKLP